MSQDYQANAKALLPWGTKTEQSLLSLGLENKDRIKEVELRLDLLTQRIETIELGQVKELPLPKLTDA